MDSPPSVVSGNASKMSYSHVLAFEYPAFDLLPAGAMLDIDRPAQVEHRPKPDVNSMFPELGTEFFAILKADEIKRPHEANDAPSRLLSTIADLKGVPGSSCLRIATFKTSTGGDTLTYRIQVKIFDSRALGGMTTATQVDLNDEQWRGLALHVDREPWIHVLRDLVHRASERAFFQVRSRLLQTMGNNNLGAKQVTGEEALWQPLWLSKPPRTIVELFRARLNPITAEDSNGAIDFALPCGHNVFVPKAEVIALSAETCLTLQCPTCSARIFQHEDDAELALRGAVEEAEAFKYSNALWLSLDKETLTGQHVEHSFNSRTILEVVKLALNSFNAPRLICPPCLTPTKLYARELNSIIQHATSEYGSASGSAEVIVSPADLFDSLYGIVMHTPATEGKGAIADVAMPPSWDQFVPRWLVRAVNFLTERRCLESALGHLGVHEHEGQGLFYHTDSLTTKEAELQWQLDNISMEMKRSHLDRDRDDEDEDEDEPNAKRL